MLPPELILQILLLVIPPSNSYRSLAQTESNSKLLVKESVHFKLSTLCTHFYRLLRPFLFLNIIIRTSFEALKFCELIDSGVVVVGGGGECGGKIGVVRVIEIRFGTGYEGDSNLISVNWIARVLARVEKGGLKRVTISGVDGLDLGELMGGFTRSFLPCPSIHSGS